MSRPTVSAIGRAMVEAGVITEGDYFNTRRIVIDLPADGIPILYMERYVDDKLLKVFTTLEGIEIWGRTTHGPVGRAGADAGRSEEGERTVEEQDSQKRPAEGFAEHWPAAHSGDGDQYDDSFTGPSL